MCTFKKRRAEGVGQRLCIARSCNTSDLLHLSRHRVSALLWQADMFSRFWWERHCGREWRKLEGVSVLLKGPLYRTYPTTPPTPSPCSLNTINGLWNSIGCLQKSLLQAVNIYVNCPDIRTKPLSLLPPSLNGGHTARWGENVLCWYLEIRLELNYLLPDLCWGSYAVCFLKLPHLTGSNHELKYYIFSQNGKSHNSIS